MKVKYMYLMEMVITQFEQMMDYLTIARAGPNGVRLLFFALVYNFLHWLLNYKINIQNAY